MNVRARTRADLKAVLGPTNTGKTHLAIERMLGHASGMIGLPLRLLAREVYDRVVAAKGAAAAALITGEEKIAPESARYFICTVEAMPLNRAVAFVAIDEIQVARDLDRGHVFTERILHARGFDETMLLGSDTMRPMIRALLPEAEIIQRERLSTLSYTGPSKITKLQKRTAVVAFSAEEVYAIAELLRRHRGGAAVVMGALSPRTRNAQVALYQSGEVDFLVATDAIGMGLNMDVDHVAFASRRKFDGRMWRDLRADEVAQIAGRAGRFTRDGNFGETGECAPFDEDTLHRVETHEFEAVDSIQWRNPELKFGSCAALLQSLERGPDRPGLMRVRGADDEEVLKRLMNEPDVVSLARSAPQVQRLWEACQLPDFRKIAPEEHARLVGRIAGYILPDRGRIPREWANAEIEKLDRPQGDLDMLQQRLAHVRTWSYIAHRADWLDDAETFRARTRDVEDKLSDALHEALTQRFIDRRTSALLKSLKREDALPASVSADGEVTVEGHHVGRLDGLAFVPDPKAIGLEGRAVRNAALRALRPEVSRRLAHIASCDDAAMSLGRDGRIRIDGAAIARIVAGGAPLKPKLDLIGADNAGVAERAAAQQRVAGWLDKTIATVLRPLVSIETAWREAELRGEARGIAFRLLENGGALDRGGEDPAAFTPDATEALQRLGVRVGKQSVFVPQLLKPRAAHVLAILWHAAHPHRGHHGVFLPRPGALSAPLDHSRWWGECAAAGYRPCGRVAIRFDIVERLVEALDSDAQPDDAALAQLIGRPVRELAGVLTTLAYRRDETTKFWKPYTAKPKKTRPVKHGPFAELATLLPAVQHRRRGRPA
jgi:ATP-dependent RNA helicase SUPV3L1/SUV3